eukprot:m.25113 g.25113  ORF g.25113 m.25113 type:complete len:51 (-) comp4388_c0_seq1:1819-1971(-)
MKACGAQAAAATPLRTKDQRPDVGWVGMPEELLKVHVHLLVGNVPWAKPA